MKKISFAIIIGFIFTLCISAYSEDVQAKLAHQFVRFHVIANSDSVEDQALKLKVRDRIIEQTKPLFEQSENIKQTKQKINENIMLIEAMAQEEVVKSGADYKVTVFFGNYPFPTKKYGDVTLPAGNYEALRIVIGEGAGKNWWCVLFPPLCFVDATHGEVPEDAKQHLKKVLTEEEYKIITTAQNEGEIPVVIKFKIVEWWQSSKIKVQTAFNHTN